jgi:hypothetical protein
MLDEEDTNFHHHPISVEIGFDPQVTANFEINLSAAAATKTFSLLLD